MGLIGKIWVRLGLDNSEYKRGIQDTERQTDGFQNKMKALGGALLAAFSIQKVIEWGRAAVKAYNEQAIAVAKLENVLKTTGNAAGITSRELQRYATELQKQTTFGDETTLEAMARLATFKSISKDIFKNAIVSAMDLATIMGTDLNSAILLIGKALEQPEQGIQLLNRSTRAFTQEQIEGIQKLVQEGKKYEAQLLILNGLNQKVGGTAKAAADTAAGAWVIAGTAFGDVMEELGSAIETTKNFAKGLTEALYTLQIIIKIRRGLTARGRREFREEQEAIKYAEQEMKGIQSVEQAEKRLDIIRNDKGYKVEKLIQYLEDYIQKNKKVVETTEEEVSVIANGLIPTIQKQIDLLNELKNTKNAASDITAINDEIAALGRRLEMLQRTSEQLKELARLEAMRAENDTAPIKRGGNIKTPTGVVSPFDVNNFTPNIPNKNPYENILNQGDEAIDRFQEQMEQLQITGNDLAYVISDTISGAIETMVKSINETGKIDGEALRAAIILPLLGMAKQMGEVLIAAGIGSISLKKLFADPVSAIAAGTALVALSSYAISKFQAAANNVSGGSESSTSFVGGAGGFNTAQSMQSPQLNLVGVLKGSDIYLSVQKETEKRVR